MSSMPDLSVVILVTTSIKDTMATLNCVMKQTIAEQIELILVGLEAGVFDELPVDLKQNLWDVKTIILEDFVGVDFATAKGTQLATAPYIAMIEDHVLPSDNWAEVVYQAHESGYEIVATPIENGNPATALSWGNVLLGYGEWLIPTETGEVSNIPVHNVSLGRKIIDYFGDTLGDRLGREGGMMKELREQGYPLYLSPDAQLGHVNPSRLLPTMILRFDVGRSYGATRAEQGNWSVFKRLVYIIGGPLIPLVRFIRMRQQHFGAGKRGNEKIRAYLGLMFCLLMDGLGQMYGYAFGLGKAYDRLIVFEVGRCHHVVEQDKKILQGRELLDT